MLARIRTQIGIKSDHVWYSNNRELVLRSFGAEGPEVQGLGLVGVRGFQGLGAGGAEFGPLMKE